VPGNVNTLYDGIKSKNVKINVLVNNAGFGDYGYFKDSDMKKTEEMINLNILALTKLTRLFIDDIVESKGMILNVASTAAFQPGPLMSVYYATKAYVLSFSEAIAEELKDSEVSVTALCPGPTKSGFQDAANLTNSKLFDGRKIPTSKDVAEYAYNSLLSGKRVAIHGFQNKMLAHTVKFLPRKTVTKMVKKISERKDV
jgi:short-subunit dehydrogenase